MKEKKFLRWLLTWAVIILLGYIAVSQILGIVLDNVFEDQLLNLTNEYKYYQTDLKFDADRYDIKMDHPDLITVRGLEERGRTIYLVTEPAAKEEGNVYIEIYDKEAGYNVDSAFLKVTKRGLIIDKQNGNFTHCRHRQICILVAIIALTLLLWIGYFKSVRTLRFSYHSIFCIGLGIWGIIICIIMLIQFFRMDIMLNYYSSLAGIAERFILFTLPFILIFAILLSISNISLIRHEGFRMRNALGIILSLVMIGGIVFLLFLGNIYNSGNEFYIDLWSSVCSVIACIYAVLECFLIGAIICGTRAARNQPAFDKDYIVILGCMIRKDGGLYPLIRGRVDRAIAFYNAQEKATGKKAVFIPSGGKGSDEPIAEGAAMKRYLLEQGIPEEQILVEDQSINTRQNMQFSKKLMASDTKAVFSTTNFHVFRSGIIAGQVDFEADGMGSPTKWYFWPNAYIREVIGMLSYKWKSLVIIFIPIAAFLVTVRMVF